MADVIIQNNFDDHFGPRQIGIQENAEPMELANSHQDESIGAENVEISVMECESRHPTQEASLQPLGGDVKEEGGANAEIAPSSTPSTASPVQYKKGDRVIYRNLSTGVTEEMIVVGVHFDDFPNIYYTVQQVHASEDGYKKEKQTDASRLSPAPKQEEQTEKRNESPVTVLKEDTDSDKDAAGNIERKAGKDGSRKIPIKIEQSSNKKPRQQHQQQPSAHKSQTQAHPHFRAPEPEVFDIIVTFDGRRSLLLTVSPDSTVGDVLTYFSQYLGIPVSMLRMVHKNMYVNNRRLTMDSLGIVKGSRIMITTSCGWF